MFSMLLPFLGCPREKAAMSCLSHRAMLVAQVWPSGLLFTFSSKSSQVVA